MRLIEFGYRRELLKGPFSRVLDHLRWISALCVCTSHIRNLLFPDAILVAHMNILVKFFYFLTLFGTQAVVVFFVISGLLVGGKVVSGVRKGNFSVGHYSIDRLTRLYIVLIPAILLSVLLSPLSTTGECPSTPLHIMGNLIFLQNVSVPTMCNNHPLWSLSNEAFYYLAAGLVAVFIIGKYRYVAGALGFATLALLLITATLDRENILISAPIWCLGIMPWFIRIRFPFYVFGSLCLLALLISRAHLFPNPYVDDLCVGCTFALTLSSDWNLTIPRGAWLAGFSYSLYLIHMPLAQAAAHFIPICNPSSFSSYIVYALVITTIVSTAWLFGYLFEAKTAALRKIMTDYFMKTCRARP